MNDAYWIGNYGQEDDHKAANRPEIPFAPEGNGAAPHRQTPADLLVPALTPDLSLLKVQ